MTPDGAGDDFESDIATRNVCVPEQQAHFRRQAPKRSRKGQSGRRRGHPLGAKLSRVATAVYVNRGVESGGGRGGVAVDGREHRKRADSNDGGWCQCSRLPKHVRTITQVSFSLFKRRSKSWQ